MERRRRRGFTQQPLATAAGANSWAMTLRWQGCERARASTRLFRYSCFPSGRSGVRGYAVDRPVHGVGRADVSEWRLGVLPHPPLVHRWLGSDGGVYAFGAPFDGSVPALGQHVSNVVGMAATADGGGYFLVTSTGAVYAFGDAKHQGGANTLPRINAPIVGITLDSTTGGYWLAGSDGGIYAFGAPFEGSAGGTKLNAPIVGISATTSGSGYYLAASDGGVFSYNAPFLGSMGGKHLNAPMVGMTVAG